MNYRENVPPLSDKQKKAILMDLNAWINKEYPRDGVKFLKIADLRDEMPFILNHIQFKL